MGQEIKPGDTVRVSHDIAVGNQYAFISSEQVIVESISVNTQRPAYKYVVFSQRLLKKFQLSDNDVSLPAALPVATRDVTREPLSAQKASRPAKPATLKERLVDLPVSKSVVVVAAVGLVLVVAIVCINLFRASSPEATAKAFFAAGESFDINGMIAQMDPTALAQNPSQKSQLEQQFGK